MVSRMSEEGVESLDENESKMDERHEVCQNSSIDDFMRGLEIYKVVHTERGTVEFIINDHRHGVPKELGKKHASEYKKKMEEEAKIKEDALKKVKKEAEEKIKHEHQARLEAIEKAKKKAAEKTKELKRAEAEAKKKAAE